MSTLTIQPPPTLGKAKRRTRADHRELPDEARESGLPVPVDGSAQWAVQIIAPRGAVLDQIPVSARGAALFALKAASRPWARLTLADPDRLWVLPKWGKSTSDATGRASKTELGNAVNAPFNRVVLVDRPVTVEGDDAGEL